MFRRMFVIFASTLITIGLCGCKKSTTQGTQQAQPRRTAAEHQARAEKEIDSNNMAAELDKIEKDMQEEAAREGLP